MNFVIAKQQLEKMLKEKNSYLLLALGLISICLLQVILMFFIINREKIILVPPSIEKSFWVSAQQVSSEYLAEMTRFFASLRLNVTSESANVQRKTLLSYTDPDFYGVLNIQLVEEGDRIKEQHLSIAFFPNTDIKTNEKKLQAIIEGDLKSYVGDTFLNVKHIRYLLSYNYHSGRLFLKSFEEVKA